MNRKSKSFSRRSSILKVDANWDTDTQSHTGILGRNRRSSRRVSFAETYQVKEFPRDSPRAFKDLHNDSQADSDPPETSSKIGGQARSEGIIGLDKLLTGAIQTPYQTDNYQTDNDNLIFNPFDKTILDPVDMETTCTDGNNFPQMNFLNEPSMELTFDASSLLKSLKRKTSDSLKTVQLYSPDRQRTVQNEDMQSDLNEDPLSLNLNFSEHDKENIMIPMEALQNAGNTSSLQSKAFIGRFVSHGANLDQTQMNEDMDMTVYPDNVYDVEKENMMAHMNKTWHMEETVPVGGILNPVSGGILNPVSGGILNPVSANESFKSGGLKMQPDYFSGLNSDDKTHCFNRDDENCVMEETKCIGGILNNADTVRQRTLQNTTVPSLPTSLKSLSKTIPTDSELSQENTNSKPLSIHQGEVNRAAIDAVNADDSIGMDITLDITQSVPMEETKALGNIILTEPKNTLDIRTDDVNNLVLMDKTIKLSENMEETRPIGGILGYKNDSPSPVNTSIRVSASTVDTTVKLSEAMEETRPIGGILKSNTVTDCSSVGLPSSMTETTRILSEVMDETKPVGGILNQHVTDIVNGAQTMTGNKLNTTNNQTLAIDATEVVGGILDQSVSDNMYEKLNKTVNQTMPIEETKPVGGILDKTEDKTLYFEDVNTDWTSAGLRTDLVGKASDGTVINKQQSVYVMEETRCITGVIEVQTKHHEAIPENIANIHDRNATVMDTTDMQLTRTDLESRGSLGNDQQQQMADIEVDDEITLNFKGFNNKRNYDECRETRNSDECQQPDDRTKDVTQTTTGLAKLKERLASVRRNSLTKTPSKISPFTPNSLTQSASKGACNVTAEIDVTRSPHHKRQKLFDSPDVEDSPAYLSTSLDGDDKSAPQLGIDDEQMPEGMSMSLSPVSSCNDRNLSSLSHNISSTTQLDGNTTHSSHNDTRSSHNDTRSSASVDMSTLSNKSFKSSFYKYNVPDGPMTMASFYKLTTGLQTKVISNRQSTVFAPRIDLDDLVEVLEAELTIGPKVKAREKFKENFAELTKRSEENIEWLEKMLEETQPQIFQDCANASHDELHEILRGLNSLSYACHKKACKEWNNGMRQTLEETLTHLQETGLPQAEHLLEKVQAENQSVEDLLASLDEDLMDMENNEKTLLNLDQEQANLEGELMKLKDEMETETGVKVKLESSLKEKTEQDESLEEYKTEKSALTQQLACYFECTEWCLEQHDVNKAVFSFFNEKVQLCVEFQPGVEERSITNISLTTKKLPNSYSLGARITINFITRGINVEDLMKKYKTFSSLKGLLHEVSSKVNEIKRFGKEIELVYKYKPYKYVNDSILVEIWNRETMALVCLHLIFDPSHPLTKHISCKVKVKFGGLKHTLIEKCLQDIKPGQQYLERLLQCVDFKQLKTIQDDMLKSMS